jgi:hypothetical protein
MMGEKGSPMTQWIKIDYDNIDTSKPPFDGHIYDLWTQSGYRLVDCFWVARRGAFMEFKTELEWAKPALTHYMPLPEPPEDV